MFTPDQLSLEGFLEFAQSKPLKERYDYMDSSSCAVAQYVWSLVPDATNVKTTVFQIDVSLDDRRYVLSSKDFPIIAQLDRLANATDREWFGALAKRIEKELANVQS